MSDTIMMTDTDDPSAVIDRVLRASAILAAYVGSLDEDRAEERYVIWTVRDILSQVAGDIDRIPVRLPPQQGKKLPPHAEEVQQ